MKRGLRSAKWRAILLGCAAAALGAGLLLALALGGGHIGVNSRADDRSSASEPEPVLVPGTPAAFRYLVNQRSNRCGMRPAELERFPPTQHLQGSCCDPMDQSTYEWQVKAIRSYAFTAQIPRDPYDVPASLARRLLDYDKTIRLTAAQQATYDRAMRMSREKGPCCCHCWRWNAFRGMSKYLIARPHWTASRVALIIDDVEGCGGRDAPPSLPSPATT